MKIVQVNFPALLGLDMIDEEHSYVDSVTNRLVHRRILNRSSESLRYLYQLSMPIIRHDNHLYSKMCFHPSTFYSTAKILKLTCQFGHPSAETLHALLRRAGLKAVTQQTLELLKEIVSYCESCQRIRNAPLRFRVPLGYENVRFNARAYIDVTYLDGKPVLHIVDEATRFSAARLLPKMSTDAIWDSIVLCWSSVCTGLPDNIMVDEGSQFRKIFAELAALHDVNI